MTLNRMTRREFVPAAAGLAAAACGKSAPPPFAGKSAVAIVKAASYSADLVSKMREGVKACGLDVRGKSVLLKPTLVEFDRATSINTDVAVVAAAFELFKSLGAASVVIAEGPGHRRDTLSLGEEAGYSKGIEKFEDNFVDLNRDDVTAVKRFADEKEIYLPNTALGAVPGPAQTRLGGADRPLGARNGVREGAMSDSAAVFHGLSDFD